jgi:hypothetical protein
MAYQPGEKCHLVVGVDLGYGSDMTAIVVVRVHPDGSYEVVDENGGLRGSKNTAKPANRRSVPTRRLVRP